MRNPKSGTEFDKARAAQRFIARQTKLRPRLGLILGSGLGSFVERLRSSTSIPYERIPGFPAPQVEGHAGRLVLGCCGLVPLTVLQGRSHLYEGFSAQEVAFPVRVLGLGGVKILIITNAAGGISRRLNPPTLMLIRDHLNLQGVNPLVGANDSRFGPRFPDMSAAYSRALIQAARKAARKARVSVRQGVYAAVQGPCFETPAEARALARLGADAVGMSTAAEVVAARHMGIDILGISCITNWAAGLTRKPLTHAEVLRGAQHMGRNLTALLEALMPTLARRAL